MCFSVSQHTNCSGAAGRGFKENKEQTPAQAALTASPVVSHRCPFPLCPCAVTRTHRAPGPARTPSSALQAVVAPPHHQIRHISLRDRWFVTSAAGAGLWWQQVAAEPCQGESVRGAGASAALKSHLFALVTLTGSQGAVPWLEPAQAAAGTEARALYKAHTRPSLRCGFIGAASPARGFQALDTELGVCIKFSSTP